jgi:hypothetical protein
MSVGPVGGGTGGDLSVGPALEQLRKDNALTSQVHDPAEDEPHIVGIPKRFQVPDGDAPEAPHS